MRKKSNHYKSKVRILREKCQNILSDIFRILITLVGYFRRQIIRGAIPYAITMVVENFVKFDFSTGFIKREILNLLAHPNHIFKNVMTLKRIWRNSNEFQESLLFQRKNYMDLENCPLFGGCPRTCRFDFFFLNFIILKIYKKNNLNVALKLIRNYVQYFHI